MPTNKAVFKTLRKVDGKDYVEVAEVLEIFRNLASMPSFFAGVADTLKQVEENLDKVSKQI